MEGNSQAYYYRVVDLEARLRDSNKAIESYCRSTRSITTNESALKKLDAEFEEAKKAALKSLDNNNNNNAEVSSNWRAQCEALEAILEQERKEANADRAKASINEQSNRALIAKASDRHKILREENLKLRGEAEARAVGQKKDLQEENARLKREVASLMEVPLIHRLVARAPRSSPELLEARQSS